METDEQEDFVVNSETAVPDHIASSSKQHPANEPIGETTVNDEDIESDDDDDEEEEEEGGDISLGEEDIDEEEGEADEDEEMQDADVADEDITMQSVEHNGPVEHNGSTN